MNVAFRWAEPARGAPAGAGAEQAAVDVAGFFARYARDFDWRAEVVSVRIYQLHGERKGRKFRAQLLGEFSGLNF